jgi:hypothetical protein
MFGLAIAALIVGYETAVSGAAIAVAVSTALYFLFYWHLTFYILFAVIVTFAGTAVGGSHAGGPGAVIGTLGGLVIALLMGALPAALSLSGTYIMYHALIGHLTFETVNMAPFLIGAFMYGVSVLMYIANRASHKSED